MSQPKTAVGYLLPTREIVMAQATPDCSRIMELAESAETLGFDSIWVGDSILARPRLEPLTTLAAAASRTNQVKLGTAVLLPALRHPVVLANEVANLDLLCNGRLILGLGIAGNNDLIKREFAGCCSSATAGSRCPTPRRASPGTGSGSNLWRKRWDRTPPDSPAPSTSPST